MSICVYTSISIYNMYIHYIHTNKSAVHATTLPQRNQLLSKLVNLLLLEPHALRYCHDRRHVP